MKLRELTESTSSQLAAQKIEKLLKKYWPDKNVYTTPESKTNSPVGVLLNEAGETFDIALQSFVHFPFGKVLAGARLLSLIWERNFEPLDLANLHDDDEFKETVPPFKYQLEQDKEKLFKFIQELISIFDAKFFVFGQNFKPDGRSEAEYIDDVLISTDKFYMSDVDHFLQRATAVYEEQELIFFYDVNYEN